MMTKKALRLALSATLATSLVACSNKANNNEVTSLDVASIKTDANLTKEQKAEKLAKAAEQLISYQGFTYANDVADLSLEVDSSNLRAQLVKAILGPIMIQKGIFARVKPLADLDAKTQAKYSEELAKFEEKTPNSTIKKFLLDGQADIKNEADIQNYVDSMADSFKAIREFAKNNKNSELTVMATDTLFPTMEDRFKKSCEVVRTKEFRYEMNCPDIKSLMEVTLNRADFEGIQHMAAGMELYFSLANSYNLTGAIAKAIELQDQKEDSKKILEDLLKNKEFATLRGGNAFQKVKDMGIDAVAGMRWIMNNQNSLCPMGESNPRNRMGMLLNNGLCTDKKNAVKDSQNLSMASDILAGKVLENVELSNRVRWTYDSGTQKWSKVILKSYKTSLKPIALFETPIADLRDIVPQTTDKCGNVLSIKDTSFGGVFVKGDVNNYLSSAAECAQ